MRRRTIRHVWLAAAIKVLARRKARAETPIGYLDRHDRRAELPCPAFTIIDDDEVLRLDVAMADADRMAGFDGVAHLTEHPADEPEPPAGKHLVVGRAGEERRRRRGVLFERRRARCGTAEGTGRRCELGMDRVGPGSERVEVFAVASLLEPVEAANTRRQRHSPLVTYDCERTDPAPDNTR